MSDDRLFSLPSDEFKQTSDDCYTPRWVSDAMGLQFDLDVAAPKGGPWHTGRREPQDEAIRTMLRLAR